MNSFYTCEELKSLGFKKIGKNVFISKKASFYGAENMIIGEHVRIDDFCILSGRIEIGDYVHVSAYVALYGGEQGIEVKDYVAISVRTTIFTDCDDYYGEGMTNPMVPIEFRNVYSGKVILEKYVIIGASSIILPNVLLREGSSFGSFSLVKNDSEEWTIYAGIPCKKIKERSRKLLKKEMAMIEKLSIRDQLDEK